MKTLICLVLATTISSTTLANQQDSKSKNESAKSRIQKVDIDDVLEKSDSSTSTEMFLAAAAAYQAKRYEDAGFLFYTAQIRSRTDLNTFRPRKTGSGNPVVLISALNVKLGEVINPALMRQPDIFANVIARIEDWQPSYDDSYTPGWKFSERKAVKKSAALADKTKQSFLQSMQPLSKLLLDPEYFEIFKTVQDKNLSREFLQRIEGNTYEPKVVSAENLGRLKARGAEIELEHGKQVIFSRERKPVTLPNPDELRRLLQK
jgi:hypothetical protein